MIWATVSFRYCFCWLYRASPPLAAKSKINLISVLIIWWFPYVESSLVLLEEHVYMTVCSLGKTLLAFALFHFVFQGQTCLLLQVCLNFLLLHSRFLWWKWNIFFFLFGFSSKRSCWSSKGCSTLASSAYWLGHRLGLLWCWMACLGNEQRSFCHFWDCNQVLHFRLLLTIRAIPFLLRDSVQSSRYNGHLNTTQP